MIEDEEGKRIPLRLVKKYIVSISYKRAKGNLTSSLISSSESTANCPTLRFSLFLHKYINGTTESVDSLNIASNELMKGVQERRS